MRYENSINNLTEDQKLELLIAMLRISESKAHRLVVLESYIQTEGPIPNDYSDEIIKLLER